VTTATRAAVLGAVGLARRGEVYDLAHELHRGMPQAGPGVMMPFTLSTYRSPEDMAKDTSMNGITFHVDMVQASFHTGTHIDALVHCQYQGRIHGGASYSEARGDFGWSEQGAETIEPMVSRGLMIDVAAAKGVDILPDSYAVTIDDLQHALAIQGTPVQPGDTILLRTGKARQYNTDAAAFQAACPGLGRPAAAWLLEQGMSAFAIDSTSADAQPETWVDATHVLLLVERGVLIMENVYMEDLSRDHAYEFLFICTPLKLKGATGSWIRPIAIA
jgi:kynurenine formamidase